MAIAGPIGFVALVSPHIVRRLLRTSDARIVLPVSAAVGAILVVGADMAARLALHPHEIAVGLWTVALGAPALLVLHAARVVAEKGYPVTATAVADRRGRPFAASGARSRRVLVTLGAVLLASMFAYVMLGPVIFGPELVLKALIDQAEEVHHRISVWEVRLPAS